MAPLSCVEACNQQAARRKGTEELRQLVLACLATAHLETPHITWARCFIELPTSRSHCSPSKDPNRIAMLHES